MRTLMTGLLAAGLAVLVTAGSALAFTNVTVLTEGGQPVKNAMLTLPDGKAVGTTDDNGRARLDLGRGKHVINIESAYTAPVRRSFVEPEQGEGNVTFRVPLRSSIGANNPPFGTVAVGPKYQGSWHTSLTPTLRRLIDTTPAATFPITASRADLAAAERNIEQTLRVDEALADVAIGLPRFTLLDCMTLSPGVSVGLGSNSLRYEETDRSNRANDFKATGTGFSWNFNLEGMVSPVPHDGHAWMNDGFVRFGYGRGGGSADVDVSPRTDLRGTSPAGTIIEQEGDFRWTTEDVYAHIGRGFFRNRVTPYVGAGWQRRTTTFELESRTNVLGLGDVNRKVRRETEDEDWRGVAGVETNFLGALWKPLDRLHMRAEVATNGTSTSALFKAVYHFDFFCGCER
jgi:hypothetical protein